MDNIIDIELTGRSTRRDQKLWQYDYGQILRISGKEFPKVTEVQFSLQQSGGHTLDRIGTFDNGVLAVQIPNELLQNKGETSDYTIYAFVYLSGDESGNTKYMIQLPVESRPEPTDPSEDPSIDPSIFKDAVNAVNASAERAETAEKSARESAAKAKGYAESAGKSKEDVENARDNAISAIGTAKESALSDIASKTDESVQKIQSQTEASQNSIKQSIADATEKKTELDGAISNATDAKGNLEKAVQSAENAKSELDTSAREAGEAKTALDSSISSASEKQTVLDTTVTKADTLDKSLKENIQTGTQLQKDLVASGEKAVEDIQTAGNEQLGKMQTVAEEFTADREQITKNKNDISSLNEELSDLQDKKITKFYASNQGETHLADSDNGKMQDMMIYGKSSQVTTIGKNLLKIKDATQTVRGVTIASKDGILSVQGTATETGWAYLNIATQTFADGTYIVSYKANNNNKPKLLLANVAGGRVIEQNVATALSNVEIAKICFVITKGETYNMTDVKIQLELGSEATAYEPYTGGKPSPSPEYPQEIKSVVNPTVKVSSEDETESQTVALPYTFNAIPVSSGGNVTIGKQQYISDYLDIEKGKLYRKVKRLNLKDVDATSIAHSFHSNGNGYLSFGVKNVSKEHQPISNRYRGSKWTQISGYTYTPSSNTIVFVDDRFTDRQTAIKLVQDTYAIYVLSTPTEEDLPLEQIKSLKSLSTNYPVTNITVGSEELDGYAVFNYPISMENGWNYVKQQLGDTRDYIYDMDAKAQDIDIQSAEAYVNSEYAVALTELEV